MTCNSPDLGEFEATCYRNGSQESVSEMGLVDIFSTKKVN